jgi:hypothetical protein
LQTWHHGVFLSLLLAHGQNLQPRHASASFVPPRAYPLMVIRSIGSSFAPGPFSFDGSLAGRLVNRLKRPILKPRKPWAASRLKAYPN